MGLTINYRLALQEPVAEAVVRELRKVSVNDNVISRGGGVQEVRIIVDTF